MARRTYTLARQIGKRIERARLEAGMTQRELAQAAQVTITTIDNLNHGRVRNPGVGTLRDVADALGVSAGWLCFGEGSK